MTEMLEEAIRVAKALPPNPSRTRSLLQCSLRSRTSAAGLSRSLGHMMRWRTSLVKLSKNIVQGARCPWIPIGCEVADHRAIPKGA